MFQHELEAAQRLHQADLVVDEQVVAISTECLRAEKQTRTTMRQPVWGGEFQKNGRMKGALLSCSTFWNTLKSAKKTISHCLYCLIDFIGFPVKAWTHLSHRVDSTLHVTAVESHQISIHDSVLKRNSIDFSPLRDMKAATRSACCSRWAAFVSSEGTKVTMWNKMSLPASDGRHMYAPFFNVFYWGKSFDLSEQDFLSLSHPYCSFWVLHVTSSNGLAWLFDNLEGYYAPHIYNGSQVCAAGRPVQQPHFIMKLFSRMQNVGWHCLAEISIAWMATRFSKTWTDLSAWMLPSQKCKGYPRHWY